MHVYFERRIPKKHPWRRGISQLRNVFVMSYRLYVQFLMASVRFTADRHTGLSQRALESG